MQHFELKAQTRKAGGKAAIKAVRREGLIPCNLYGGGIDNALLTISTKDLKALVNTPNSYIVDLLIDGSKKKQTAVLHELQWHPVTDECLHVDFLAVSEDKPVSIAVPVEIVGHAIGMQQGGKFYQRERKLRISAMMKDLPDKISVDISSLGLDKKIRAADITVEKATVLSDKDTIICGVKATRNSAAAAAAKE